MSDQPTIPQHIVDTLELVRRDGRTSMGNRAFVLDLATLYGGTPAREWLEAADDELYMAALRAMGANVTENRASRGPLATEGGLGFQRRLRELDEAP